MTKLQDILSKYKDCLFYDQLREERVISGNTIELANIGTDFARNQMYSEAVECWEYILNGDFPIDSSVYCNLGVCYFYGNGVTINLEKAVHYYQKAAAKGHPFGQYNFAVALEQGKGIEQNILKAIEFYQKAAEQLVNQAIDALVRLGVYNELGLAFYNRNFEDDSFSGK